MTDERGPLPMAKRRAGGQMTKDDFDQDDDSPAVDPGDWKPADDETLKKRRIIKVRRGGAAGEATPSADAAAAPLADADKSADEKPAAASTNPFGGISLTAPAANPFAGVSLAAGAGSKPFGGASFSFNKEETKPADASKTAAAEVRTDEQAVQQASAGNKTDDKQADKAEADKPADEKKAADDSKVTEGQQKHAGTGFGGFGAFGAGFGSGSGFGGFGSTAAASGGFGKGAGFGSTTAAAGSDAEPSKPIFGFATGSSSFGSFTAPALGSGTEAALFGSSAGGSAAPEPKPVVQLEEQALVTGEEEEQVVFSATAGKLFEFDNASKAWKLRGDGEFRINVDQKGQARMVMRQRGNLRLILNAKLFPQMTIAHMVGNNKAATFACINAVSMADAGGKGEGKEGEKSEKSEAGEKGEPAAAVLKTWAVSIKSEDKVNQLIEVVNKHKGAAAASGAAHAAEGEQQV